MASKSNTKETISCSHFLELTVAELKYYLAQRGLSQDGTKLDLAARALVAYEKNEPVRKDIKSLEDELKDTNCLETTTSKTPTRSVMKTGLMMFPFGHVSTSAKFFHILSTKKRLKPNTLDNIRQKRPIPTS